MDDSTYRRELGALTNGHTAPLLGPLGTHANIGLAYANIVGAHFLGRLVEDKLTFVRGDGWRTAADTTAIPGEAIIRVHYSRLRRYEVLLKLEGAVVHLALRENQLDLKIAGRTEAVCAAALAALEGALPRDEGEGDEASVSFWWWDGGSPGQLARRMIAPTWSGIRDNYASGTAQALDSLMSWTAPPTTGGRLILWHGVPGTGKTTALRALAREWSDWADLQFITDPELFLDRPSYLLNVISDASQDASDSRWHVLVLEDSGEFLLPDAKHMNGQALSRLLNVCDGALGQATRSLILVTANENVRRLHPAVTRPGRCVANVGFRELDGEDIARWCEARGVPQLRRERAALADLYGHVQGRIDGPAADAFGFGASIPAEP